jgi:uncharacterized protein (DUF1697 family)
MSRYIAFLRAINVGGHTVKMELLRALFVSLGLANVETFIASGNVIFDSPETDAQALEKMLESGLRQSLGYAVATFLRSTVELAEIARYQPFAAAEPGTASPSLYIAFLPAVPTGAAQQKLMAFRTDLDDFHCHKREIYWLCRTKSSDSMFSGALLEKTIGMPATLRNATTVQKLAAKYPAP